MATQTNGSGETNGARFLSALTRSDDPEHRDPAMLLYRLLKLAHLIQRPFMVPGTNAYELNVNELRLVVTLAHLGEAASHELCEVAALHPMNVSRAVARLRKQGRVAERRDAANGRRKILTLTDEGRRLYAEMVPEIDEAAARLFAGLDPAMLDTLSTLIDRLTGNVAAPDSDPA
jgi:DNA-binding MarR family transcriptional regulator